MASNHKIAEILEEIGELLEAQDVEFKPRAYQKASQTLESLPQEVEKIYKNEGLEGLEDLPGIGESIAEKIAEMIKTEEIEYYEKLKEKFPVDMKEITEIEGVGPKTTIRLHKALGIKTLKDLKKAAKENKIRDVDGFGKKTEENILQGIQFLKKSKERFILGFEIPRIREIKEKMEEAEGVKKVTVAGSARRKKETIGDIDLLALSEKPERLMKTFTDMEEVSYVYSKGKTKSSVKLKSGIDVDLRIVPEESYGSALHYFTGSKDHNVTLREIAIDKGYKLNEYGIFNQQEERIAGKTEEGVYNTLGLPYIEPELRENTGEIKAAQENKLPDLIKYNELKGDLQIQTEWSDGDHSIEEMARKAMDLGLGYIAITDHTQSLAMANGLGPEEVKKQSEKIDELNKRIRDKEENFKILKSSECDILKNGEMDLPNDILAELDIVGGAIHSHFSLSEEEQTERIKRAMENPYVDIIFHPTGRKIHKRKPYQVNMEEMIEVAKKTGTILEVNAFPDRLDLKDIYIKQCVESGVKMSISTDAHSKHHMDYLEYGVAQARRGWSEKRNIINAWPLEKMLSFTKRK